MKFYRFVTILSAFFIFCTFLMPLSILVNLYFSKEAFFEFNNFKKIEIKLDTIQVLDGSKGGISFVGKAYNNKLNVKTFGVWFVKDPNNFQYIDSMFNTNNHKLWVFLKDYESPAYFVEDEFQEMSFKTIWLPVLRNLGIFILIVLNFFFWRHKYHQAILATGMSLDEYSRLQESKRPKRKSLSEEYEEIMKRENEKKNQP